jgi:hypothetical protein
MVARKAHACKRPKSKKVRGYERADGSRAFAAWSPVSID